MPRAQRLRAFPRHRLIGHELLRCRASELALLERLGPPTAEADPGHHEPRFFWDLEWGCGLLTSVALDQLSEELTLHLDQPEVEHALRHLDLAPTERWTWEEAEPDRFARAVRRLPERTWSVWQVLPGDLRLCVARDLTERDARCLAGDLADEAERSREDVVHLVAGGPADDEVRVTPSASPPAG